MKTLFPVIHTVVLAVLAVLASLLAEVRSAEPPTRSQRPLPSATLVNTLIPPRPKPPMVVFRELLALSSAEREGQLNGKTEAQRKYLLAKLKEYEELPDEERERRLQMVQLRWYLRPLMELPPSARAGAVDDIPVETRKLIEERLSQWDRLPAELQREVLDNDWMVNYVVPLEGGGSAPLPNVPDERRKALEEKMGKWRALSAEERQKKIEQFDVFFGLPRKERERTLSALSDRERREIDQTLRTFERLPVQQRRVCIESFRKLARLSHEERDQFLKSADRWQAMTQRERETWRALVMKLPPMPPGLSVLPPLPAAMARGLGEKVSNSPPPFPPSPR